MIVVGEGRRKGMQEAGEEKGGENKLEGREEGDSQYYLVQKKRSKVHCSTRDYTCHRSATPTMVITEYKIR